MRYKFTLLVAFFLLLNGCMTQAPIKTVSEVNLKSFMGPWFVIGHIPTFIEKNAFNAIESYELNEDGTIGTTFTFNEGSLTGPIKTYHPKGFVVKGSGNALWGMQFIWPIKAQYKIVYLDQDYQNTIIARDDRDYVWIMSRQKKIDQDTLKNLVKKIEDDGYDIKKIRWIEHSN
ncbi:Blc Bacterial lipocalin [Candidatus Methylopumilus universalis]|uniref:lipocalin family protein n=2 Tax=Candidatus Methylopumilus TaxID=1679002 RepID=UPI00111CE0A6|nr:lipocalin family protein [Candidatus Methylopumilus planktonicus]QDD00771.1 lipocalin family protein [Candidatus Methylopumilus planktonicus]